MSQPGLGAMIHMLGGGSPRNPSDFYGRKITDAKLEDDTILLTFSDGSGAKIWDDGQSCCESRYMTCDDDLGKLVGGELRRVETKPGPDTAVEYGEHEQVFIEQVFIEIGTNECFVTVCTHNEHNGYYGGFDLSMDEVKS